MGERPKKSDTWRWHVESFIPLTSSTLARLMWSFIRYFMPQIYIDSWMVFFAYFKVANTVLSRFDGRRSAQYHSQIEYFWDFQYGSNHINRTIVRLEWWGWAGFLFFTLKYFNIFSSYGFYFFPVSAFFYSRFFVLRFFSSIMCAPLLFITPFLSSTVPKAPLMCEASRILYPKIRRFANGILSNYIVINHGINPINDHIHNYSKYPFTNLCILGYKRRAQGSY